MHLWLTFTLQYQCLSYRFVQVGSNMHKRNELYMLSKIWKKRQMVQKCSRKSFQKFRKLLNLRNANNSTENNSNCGGKVKWKENFREKKNGNFGKYCSIRYWKLPKIHTACLGWMEGAQLISGQITYLNCKCTARRETDCNFNKMGLVFQG